MEWIIPAITAVVTAIGTYLATRATNKTTDSQYVMSTVRSMFEESQRELGELKAEVRKLSDENMALKIQITELREILIKEGVHCDV